MNKDTIIILVSFFRLIPAYLIIMTSKAKKELYKDLVFWCKQCEIKHTSRFFELGVLLWRCKEFRNLVCLRFKQYDSLTRKWFFNLLYPEISTLVLNTRNVGSCLFIQHGFSTIVSAESIGDNFWVNQQVTIGYDDGRAPTIGNNVKVFAGAIIIGDVSIGDNVIIGAGSVVTKDVPSNEVWAGVPARRIRSNIH